MRRAFYMACALIETFFRIVSTLSKNDEARDLFAIGNGDDDDIALCWHSILRHDWVRTLHKRRSWARQGSGSNEWPRLTHYFVARRMAGINPTHTQHHVEHVLHICHLMISWSISPSWSCKMAKNMSYVTVEISRDTYFNVKLNDLERTKWTHS